MPLIIITFVMTVMTVGVMTVTGQSFLRCLPVVLLGMVLTGYCCALAGVLYAAVWLVRIWIAASVILCIRQLVKTIKNKTQPDLSVVLHILIFFLAMAVLWWLCRGRMFSDWDEFSFWGLAAKFTCFKDTLYTSPLFDNGFKSYPPAQIILQYLVLKVSGLPFREDAAILIPAMLSIGLLLYPSAVLIEKKKYITAAVTAAVMCFVPAMIADHPYYLTTVDMQIGVIAAFVLLVCCLEGDYKYRLAVASMASAVLTLYKSSGIGLAVIACGAGAVLMYIDNIRNSDCRIHKKISVFLPLAAAVAANLSWKLHLAAAAVEERWTAGAQNSITDVLAGNMADYQKQVVTAFIEAFFVTDSYGQLVRFSPFGWVVIAAAAAAVTAVASKEGKIKTAAPFVAAIAGYIVFAVSQLYTYMFMFEEIEAVQLASFHRYLSTPIIMMMVVSAGCLCCGLGKNTSKAVNSLTAVFLASLFVISPLTMNFCNTLINAPVNSAQTQHDRYLYIRTARYIQQLGKGEDTRLFLVSANDAGWTQMLVEYELCPHIVLPEQSSIIAAKAPQDQPWVKQMSAEEWSAMLYNGYDYVYIHCPEDQFVADYLSVFEDESQVVVDRMFEVIKHSDGTAMLRRIEMQTEDGYI